MLHEGHRPLTFTFPAPLSRIIHGGLLIIDCNFQISFLSRAVPVLWTYGLWAEHVVFACLFCFAAQLAPLFFRDWIGHWTVQYSILCSFVWGIFINKVLQLQSLLVKIHWIDKYGGDNGSDLLLFSSYFGNIRA